MKTLKNLNWTALITWIAITYIAYKIMSGLYHIFTN